MEILNKFLKKSKSLAAYKKAKIRMLARDFYIALSEAEIQHIFELPTEIQVDQYARKLLSSHLNNWRSISE